MENNNDATTIKLSKETHKKLTDIGKKGETYDEIVLRLINFWCENKV